MEYMTSWMAFLGALPESLYPPSAFLLLPSVSLNWVGSRQVGGFWTGGWAFPNGAGKKARQTGSEEWLRQASMAEKFARSRCQGTGRPSGVGGTCPLEWGVAGLDEVGVFRDHLDGRPSAPLPEPSAAH